MPRRSAALAAELSIGRQDGAPPARCRESLAAVQADPVSFGVFEVRKVPPVATDGRSRHQDRSARRLDSLKPLIDARSRVEVHPRAEVRRFVLWGAEKAAVRLKQRGRFPSTDFHPFQLLSGDALVELHGSVHVGDGNVEPHSKSTHANPRYSYRVQTACRQAKRGVEADEALAG